MDSKQLSRSSWNGAAAVAAGSRHIERGRPCQDAALVQVSPRPLLAVLDGRGSSQISQLGSTAMAAAIPAIISELDDTIATVLDTDAEVSLAEDQWRSVAQEILRRLIAVQVDCARINGHPVHELEATIVLAVVGRSRVGCLQVGDSVLAAKQGGVTGMIHVPPLSEFANWTVFITPRLHPERDLLTRTLLTAGLDGLVAMTDGMSFFLVDARSQCPAEGVRQLLERCAAGGLPAEQLAVIVEDARWSTQHHDDRGIAVLARANLSPDGSA